MAGLVLDSKVESLRGCVARIQLKCPADADAANHGRCVQRTRPHGHHR